MTSHLNQDFLENLFSTIRGQSGFKLNPTALEVKYRLKKILFGKNFNLAHKSSVAIEDSGEFLSSNYGLSKLLDLLTQDPDEDDQPNSKKRQKSKKANVPTHEVGEETVMAATAVKIRLSLINPKIDYETALNKPRSIQDKLSNAGEQYVCGYIVGKLKDNFPDLFTHDENNNENETSWVNFLSKGGLVNPSHAWLTTFNKLNEFFEAIHSTTLNFRKGIIHKLVDHLEKLYPGLPRPVLLFYVRTRTNIRIRHLNKLQINEKYLNSQKWYASKTNKTKTPNAPGEMNLNVLELEENDVLETLHNDPYDTFYFPLNGGNENGIQLANINHKGT